MTTRPPLRLKTDRRTIFVAGRKVRGTPDSNVRLKIAIGFPKEMFEHIEQLAAKNRRSFREQTIVLCEAALRDGGAAT